tara:strand:- start:98390 stop:99133 length:744 start_codon:yes stop_codon:yes gene_type:complete
MKLHQLLFAALPLLCSCSSSDDSDDPASGDANLDELHAAFAEFDTTNTDIYLDGTTIVIETNGLPNHTSPYWGEGHELYVAPEDGFAPTPSLITDRDQDATMRIPAAPVVTTPTDTSLGTIGIAVSGAALYNDQEGNGALDEAAASLDYTGAHIGPSDYHYHTEPVAFSDDDDALVGVLRDGFFVYGRKCNSTGTYPTDLDASMGHTSITQHTTEPEYHYHVDSVLADVGLYLIFAGQYQGTPGTVN